MNAQALKLSTGRSALVDRQTSEFLVSARRWRLTPADVVVGGSDLVCIVHCAGPAWHVSTWTGTAHLYFPVSRSQAADILRRHNTAEGD
jgi:hypothetical protein